MNDLDELDKPDDGGPGRTGRRSRWARRGAWALALLLVPTALAVPLANAFDPTAEDLPVSAPLAPVGLQAPVDLQSPGVGGLQSPDVIELNLDRAKAKTAEAAQASPDAEGQGQPGYMSPYSAAAAQADPNAAAAPTAIPTAIPTETPTETPTPEAAPTEPATPAPADDRAQPPIPEAIALLDNPFELVNAAMVEAGLLPGQAPQDQASQPEFMDPTSAAASAPTATPDGDAGPFALGDPWNYAIGQALANLAGYPEPMLRLRKDPYGKPTGAEGNGSTPPAGQSPDAAELNANLSTPARRDLAEAKAVLAEAEADLADAQMEPAKADVGQAISNVELARQEYGEAQLDLADDEARRKRAASVPGLCGLDGTTCNDEANANWPVDKHVYRFIRQLTRPLVSIENALKSVWTGGPGATP
jgi:hypothetical protein